MTEKTTPEYNSFVAKFFNREYLENFLSFFLLSKKELSKLYGISAELIEKWKRKTDPGRLLKERDLAEAEKETAERDFEEYVSLLKAKVQENREKMRPFLLEAEKARKEYEDFIEEANRIAEKGRDMTFGFLRWEINPIHGVLGDAPKKIISEYEKKKRNMYAAENACRNLKIKDWDVEKNGFGMYVLTKGAPDDIREEWRKKTERLREAETVLKEAERRLHVYNSINSEVSYLKVKAEKTLREKTADVEAQADGMWDLRIRYGSEAWCDIIGVDGKSDSRKPSHGTTFLCDLEPVIGDDFPVVIRQVKDNIKCMFERTLSTGMHVKPAWKSDIWDGSNWEQDMDRRERGCETLVLVIYREFRASGISEADMKAVFRSAGIYAVSETEYLTTHKSIYGYTYRDNKHVDAENPFFTMFTLTDRVTYSAPASARVSAENPDSTPAVEYDYRAVFEKERILGRILTDSELLEFVITE